METGPIVTIRTTKYTQNMQEIQTRFKKNDFHAHEECIRLHLVQTPFSDT